jgi:hypothetical protein
MVFGIKTCMAVFTKVNSQTLYHNSLIRGLELGKKSYLMRGFRNSNAVIKISGVFYWLCYTIQSVYWVAC